jgi:hypothetical protein
MSFPRNTFGTLSRRAQRIIRPILTRKFSGVAAEEQPASITNKVITSVLAGATLYCGYQLLQVAIEFPKPADLLVQKAADNNELVVLFGGKISRSYLWEGSSSESTGRASLQIPVSGPSGRKGKLYGQAVKDHKGEWVLINCELHVYKRDNDDSPTPYPTSTARAGRPMGVGVDKRTELIFDLLGPKARLEAQDIDMHGWKEGSKGAASR